MPSEGLYSSETETVGQKKNPHNTKKDNGILGVGS